MKKVILFPFIIIISLLHYFSPIDFHYLHAIYQRLYYIPIILAAYWFGLKGGLLFAFICAMFYAPHIFFQWSFLPSEAFTQYIEIIMFFVVASLVGILSNIQKLQNRQIVEAHKQILHMDRLSLLGQLAAGLAHEIRNPLGSLLGSTEILRNSLGPDHPKIEFAEIMLKELKRLRDKLNEFLAYARPAPPQKIANSLTDVIDSALPLIEKEANKGRIKIEKKYDTTLPMVLMDSEQLKQVLLNVMLNAIQSMPEGGTIMISTWQEQACIGFAIEDEGLGIIAEDREKIFVPFFTSKAKGTGLGLAIVKQLVEAQHGTIHVTDAKISHGTRFEVRIPK